MKAGKARLGLILSVPLLLAGCGGSAQGGAPSPATRTVASTSVPSSSTATDKTVAGTGTQTSPTSGATTEGAPSAKAEMVCGAETMDNVAALAGEATLPAATTTWVDHLYTCTYQLPQGPLVISVKESSDQNTARAYFETLNRDVGPATPLAQLEALGLPSFQSETGQAVFVKDNMTLKVDTTRLPALVGRASTSRINFASTIAAEILACWQEK